MLIAALWIALQFTAVQNWLIHKVTAKLSKELQTKVEIRHVDFSLFNKMHLQGVLIEDRQKDTILSAGELTVNVNDWFFIKDNIELKYIGLKNAVIKLQRSDSIWRHAFILDYFATPASTSPKKKAAINIAFKEVDLENIRIQQYDGWRGENLEGSLKSLHTSPENIDFSKKLIALASLDIDAPFFSIKNYLGKRPANYVKPKNSSTKVVADSTKDDGWRISAAAIHIKNGGFKTINEKSPLVAGEFNGSNIYFSDVNASFKNALWWKDTITAALQLTTQERSGLVVKKLAADAKVTPKEITFNNLDLQTNDSRLTNYFSMQFSQFSNMSEFIDSVELVGNFKDAYVNSDDIAFFAPALKTWKKKFQISGSVVGPVSALTGTELDLNAGTTHFTGNAMLTGLPDINSTFLDIHAQNLSTIYSDAVAIIPALKNITSPDLKQLQYVNFKGFFTGFINDFVTEGNIQTALGNLKADVNLKLPEGRSPVYSGFVVTDNFNLGKLLNNKDLGHISTNTKLKGVGFNPNNGNIAIASTINFIDYNNYRYHNIVLDGDLNPKQFDGTIHAKDSNANFSLEGLIDYTKGAPEFNFVADVINLDFAKTKLIPQPLVFRGKVNAQFKGKTIDDFLGSARITDAVLLQHNEPLSFDSLSIQSYYVDSVKNLSISSNEFMANLNGKFNIQELPNSFTAFLSRYYPSYIKPPKHIPSNQNFTFNIKTYEFNDYVRLIDSSLVGFDNVTITGKLNTSENNLIFIANVPYFQYNNIRFSDVTVSANGNYDSLALNGRTAAIAATDNAQIDYATFNVVAANDVSRIEIISGGNNTLEQARLSAFVNTYSDGVRLLFNPSNFIINGKNWSIDKNGVLEFRANTSAKGELLIKESSQEIKINTIPSTEGSWNDITVAIKNLNLGDISPYLLPQNRLEGLVTANILLENPGKNMLISSDDFMGQAIRLDNDSLGNIRASITYDFPTQTLQVKGTTLHPEQKDLSFAVDLFLKDRQSQQNNLIALNAKEFELKYLSRFLGFLFTDIQGHITGDFALRGPLDALNITGKGRLKNGGLKVNFTQCFYKIEDTDLELKEGEINLSGIILKDVVTGNPIYLTGGILHNSFQNMFYDILVSTRKPGTQSANNNKPVQVLKTTYADNKLFYGNVKATGSFALVGPENEAYMKIDAIASSRDSSTFTLASASSKAGKMPDWMVEKKFGTAMTDSSLLNANNNMIYDLDVTVNNMVAMHVLLDDYTGDEINGKGSGSLNIRSGTSEPLAIRGRLDLDEGDYNYTFQSFFKKPFVIKKGGDNYISWTGDPVAANLNLEAQYTAERVSFSPLLSLLDNNNYSRTRENVTINAKLTGKLFQPIFKFGLELDPNSQLKNDFNIANALEQIEKNESEITKQVTYLIVFNSFAPIESGGNNPNIINSVNELGYNTISSLSGLLFNEINQKLNTQLSKLLKTNVSFNFSGSVYNRNLLNASSTAFNPNQANISGALLIPAFKDRLVISLGSNLEVPLESTLDQTVQFLPDVTVSWLLNSTGSIRLNFFYRENLDYLSSTASGGAGRMKRAGGGISFRKEFDRLKEVFTGNRLRFVREDTIPQQKKTTAPPLKDTSYLIQRKDTLYKDDDL